MLNAILTVVGGYFIFTTWQKADKSEAEVAAIKDKMITFTKADHPLKLSTVDQAKANSEAASKAYNDMLAILVKKTAIAGADADKIDPIGAKNRIEKGCTKMENMLNGAGVEFSADMRQFTFGPFMNANRLPRREEIPLLLKNLEIVQELVYLISSSGVTQLSSMSRSESLDPSRRDLFNYISFNVTVSGDADSVRQLVNTLQAGKTYYYFVKAMTLTANTKLADNGADSVVGRSKLDRLALKQSQQITVGLQIDYIEFHE